MATPTLALIRIRWPPIMKGAEIALTMRSATAAASRGPSIGFSSSENSSPPSRANMSVSRVVPQSRADTCFSSASPVAWPSRETQYFGDPFEPGPSRAQWVEPTR